MCTSSDPFLVSKHHTSFKTEMADFRIEAEKVQDGLGVFFCQKVRKCSTNDGSHFKETQEPTEGAPTGQLRETLSIKINTGYP